jgi:hypothetical protein
MAGATRGDAHLSGARPCGRVDEARPANCNARCRRRDRIQAAGLRVGFVLVIAGSLLDTAFDLPQALLRWPVPVCLPVMRQRVHGRHGPVTAGRHVRPGGACCVLVPAAVIYTVFAGLTSGG